MSRCHRLLAPVVAYLLLVFPAAAEKRVALVVGNSAYVHANPLPNPVNDASDMAKALTEVGFEVILGLDLKKPAFDAKVRNYLLSHPEMLEEMVSVIEADSQRNVFVFARKL